METYETHIVALKARLADLESWRHTIITRDAVAERDRAHMDKRFDALEKRLDNADANAKAYLKVVIVAVILAACGWVIGGGLVPGVGR